MVLEPDSFIEIRNVVGGIVSRPGLDEGHQFSAPPEDLQISISYMYYMMLY